MRRSDARRVAAAAALLLFVPTGATAAATTRKAPYDFAFGFAFCVARVADSYPASQCGGDVGAQAQTGSVSVDIHIDAAVPATGLGYGIAIMGSGMYLSKRVKRLPITVTVQFDSAAASTPTPVSAAVTGSYASLSVQLGYLAVGCQRCEPAFRSFPVVQSGTPPAGAPGVPSAVPPSPVPPDLPGTIGKRTMVFRHVFRNVGPGTIGVGVLVNAIGILGNGKVQTPDTFGQRPTLPDVGKVSVKARAVIKSIKIG